MNSAKEEHVARVHRRWFSRRHRNQDSNGYQEEWWAQQCVQCLYFVPLTGPLGHDFGACSNHCSDHDQQVMYEHDGCCEFRVDPELVDESLE